MSDRIAYVNGNYVPEREGAVPIFDRAFSSGDAVYDVARTFKHVPNKLREHCERLARSAAYTRIRMPVSVEQLQDICRHVLKTNLAGVRPEDDLIIWMILTRGTESPTRNPMDAVASTLVVYTVPPHYHRFSKFYETGAHLMTASTRRTPPECLDPRAKIANKMNHIQAELEVKAGDRDAIPLMLGTDGLVAEASYANIFFVRDGRVLTPRPKNILLGIMRQNVFDIAPKANVEVVEGDFYPYDVYLADEIFLTTTSFSILPVGRFNGQPLKGVPGAVTQRLMSAWSREIGVDFVHQAKSLSVS
jgi:branched-chain amino acid aminotransferase